MDRFEVLKNILFLVVVFTRFWDHCSCNGSFAITRSVNQQQSYDVFRKVNRDSSCKDVIQRDCRSCNGMHVLNLTRCECSCSRGSTFGLYDGKWSCLNNTKIRKQTGCTLNFQGDADIINPSIKILTEQSSHKITLPSIDCWIEYSRSRYFKCDGKWAGLDTLGVTAPGPFTMLPFVETIAGTSMKLHTMKISKATVLSGRLISLHISCKTPAKSSCILFKLAGIIQCPVSFALPHPTRLTVKSNTETTPTNKVIATVVLATPKQPTPSQGISVVVVGVVTALGIVCIIGATVAIVIIVLKRKKSKRNSNTSSRDDLNASHSYVEPTSPQIPNDGVIYDYAVVEGVRKNPWRVHKDPNAGYEIPRENSKKLYINIPKSTEPVEEVAQGLREKSENSSLRDTEEYVTLYNDDGSPGWR